MNPSVLSPVTALILGLLSPGDQAHDSAIGAAADVRAMVEQAAFDPTTYFPNEYVKDSSIVRIAYTGDDYAWPVYSIAIAEGCLQGETIPRNNCAARLRARMVRAPALPDSTRPRHLGLQLVARVKETGAQSPEEVQEALSEMRLEWVEADLRTCPGALEALARSADAAWVPNAIVEPTPNDAGKDIVLHPDIIKVEFRQYARLTTYYGWVAERSPAAWAVDMASTLEPCWGPTSEQAPWLRPSE